MARVWAILRMEWAVAFAGQSRWRLPGLAALLLAPLGALRFPTLEVNATQVASVGDDAGVRGVLPPGTEDLLRLDPTAPRSLAGAAPVVLTASDVPVTVRTALDRLGPPAIRVDVRPPVAGPVLRPRALLIVLLAASLLTGPLSETLPGERSQKTLDVLLGASVTPLEIATGKWAAWTGAATLAALGSLVAGVISGAQVPGAWWLMMPWVVGSGVAVGLFLVRRADDVVTGATLPLRVLPVLAVACLGAAWAVATVVPWLGALLPWGGGLLVVLGQLSGPGPFALAVVGQTVLIGALLVGTARGLVAVDVPAEPQRSRLGLAVAAVVLFWLGALGPTVWDLAGHSDLGLDPLAASRVANVLLLCAALVGLAREPGPRVRFDLKAALEGVFLGAGIGWVGRWLPRAHGLVSDRLEAALLGHGTGPLFGLAGAVGTEVLFRHLLSRRAGEWLGFCAWMLLVPTNPLLGVASGLCLMGISRRGGLGAALLARVAWMLAAS